MSGMTHKEIAEQLGISRSRVAQIEKTALRKIAESGKMDKFMCLLEFREDYYGEEHKPLRARHKA